MNVFSILIFLFFQFERDDQPRWFHALSTEERHEVVSIVNEYAFPAPNLRRTFNCSRGEARNFIYWWKQVFTTYIPV